MVTGHNAELFWLTGTFVRRQDFVGRRERIGVSRDHEQRRWSNVLNVTAGLIFRWMSLYTTSGLFFEHRRRTKTVVIDMLSPK